MRARTRSARNASLGSPANQCPGACTLRSRGHPDRLHPVPQILKKGASRAFVSRAPRRSLNSQTKNRRALHHFLCHHRRRGSPEIYGVLRCRPAGDRFQRTPDYERWATWGPKGSGKHEVYVGTPFAGEARAGNGIMVAFAAPDEISVRAAHKAGLAAGGSDEGAPGSRPEGSTWYGAYLRDPAGNKICICHSPWNSMRAPPFPNTSRLDPRKNSFCIVRMIRLWLPAKDKSSRSPILRPSPA